MKQNPNGPYYIIKIRMSRPLFEHISRPEKTGLSRRTKIILLASVIVFHLVALYFIFTAPMPVRIVKFGPKVYSLKIVPPLPGPGAGVPQGRVVGRPPGGGVPGKPGPPAGTGGETARAARPAPPGSVPPSLPPGVERGVPSAPFALKVPVKPGPVGPEELQRGLVGGTTGAVGKPSGMPKLWTYTRTDAWGRTPLPGSGPASSGSPGGPLGSPYELMGSGTGPKVIFKGNPSAAAQGFNIGPWARKVVGLLQANWQLPALDRAKSTGQVGIAVVIEKSGHLQTIRVVNSPNAQVLIMAALNAVTRSQPLPALPDDYPGLVLEAYLLFDYHEIK
jgi:hypothetical protein